MSLKDLLKKAAEAGAPHLPRETVKTPELVEFGVEEITLQGLTGKQRDAWEGSLIVQKGNRRRVNTANVRARLVVACAIEPGTGDRALTDEDAGWLGNIRVDVLNRLYEAAQRLSGVTDEDVEELGKSSGVEDGSVSSST